MIQILTMRILTLATSAALLVTAMAKPSRAEPFLRYALIVGDNQGFTEGRTKLEPLHHAESEAARLRDALVRNGGFPQSGDRVILLQGAGRSEILGAAARLASQHHQDRGSFGNVRTMFAFFFTGHGLEDRLLTTDEPLTSADVGQIFKQIGATFSLGVFDACFSGSLDLFLHGKGIRSIRSFDAFGQLPQEVLNAEGTMWLVSSLPDQISYEDERVGGVFTHFFIEGMEAARADDFGVSLESVWEYASRRTQQHTAAAGRAQTPQKKVRELTATGPVYLGYPRRRTAQVTFSRELGGHFLLRYETGELSEILRKEPGQELRVDVFPGALWVEAAGQGTPRRQRLELAAGDRIQLYHTAGWQPKVGVGRTEIRIVSKGEEELPDIVVAREVPRFSVLVDGSYHLTLRSENASVPFHAGAIAFLLQQGRATLRLGGDMSWSSEPYAVWSASVRRYVGEVGVGLAHLTGRVQFIGSVDGRLSYTRVSYDAGVLERQSHGFGVGASLTTLIPLFERPKPLFFELRLALVGESVPSLAFAGDSKWMVMPVIGLGLAGQAW